MSIVDTFGNIWGIEKCRKEYFGKNREFVHQKNRFKQLLAPTNLNKSLNKQKKCTKYNNTYIKLGFNIIGYFLAFL